MITKQFLLQDLATTLTEALDTDSFVPNDPHPGHGNLPIAILYVRIEPWLFGFQEIKPEGAWQLAVETALHWGSTPVLAYRNDIETGPWRFRVPLYMIDAALENHPDHWHDFDRTASLFVDEFAIKLMDYQELSAVREGAASVIKAVVGVE